MINWKSVLSEYNDKPTLLTWLKKVKKALDESILTDITVAQPTAGTATLTFNFADGTEITTPAITLAKGADGKDGVNGTNGKDGVSIISTENGGTSTSGDYTETTIITNLSDGKHTSFDVLAKNGAKGEQGVSVTGVDEVSDEIVGSQTLTTLRFHFSNGETDEVVVYAENGKAGDLPANLVYSDKENMFIEQQTFNKNVTVKGAFLTNGSITTFEPTVKNATVVDPSAIMHKVPNLDEPYVYEFPEKSGTLALTSDVSTPKHYYHELTLNLFGVTYKTFYYSLGTTSIDDIAAFRTIFAGVTLPLIGGTNLGVVTIGGNMVVANDGSIQFNHIVINENNVSLTQDTASATASISITDVAKEI